MEVDDLRKISELYVCQQCAAQFLFKDDVEDHVQESGHKKILYASLDDLR